MLYCPYMVDIINLLSFCPARNLDRGWIIPSLTEHRIASSFSGAMHQGTKGIPNVGLFYCEMERYQPA